ncbi:putative RNA-binding protein (virulence factor B family) [Bacillus ectoiniformans]|uniref:CvfB family protein n=1 Tax=Bacillus ectoiniformans TaxID=1494429 RepID=UPI00195DD7DF|nr:S1-like domain-containing RNA-binding protein [Bacillus ectoiniformans]MBM7648387.1 putative RNA-binding protein (virulence factor B family) [Bacillus ectoiniformans]
MSILQAGTIVTLDVENESPFGWFLTDGEEEVLLHRSEMTDDFDPDEPVEVFLFQDNLGRLAATMHKPIITQDKYDWVEVVGVHEKLGVFVSIGLKKDVLVSVDDLPFMYSVRPIVGDRLYCTLVLDRNDRLFAKPATEDVMEKQFAKATKKDYNKDITGVVYRATKAGTFIITAEGYRGFVHDSERQVEPRLGQKVDGRIVDVKDDGSVNVSLLGRKQEVLQDDAEKIFAYLEQRGGSMPYGDKSLPEEIQTRFNLSKGAFKRALGKLMKEGRVYQEDNWTHIKKD